MNPEEIKTLRKSKGLTQEQLATIMQVDSTTIYRWENGIVSPNGVNRLSSPTVMGGSFAT